MINCRIIKALDSNNFEIHFKHYIGLKCPGNKPIREACPTRLEFPSDYKIPYKWAILQTYEERVKDRDPTPKVDGPEFQPSCHNNLKRSNSYPPYCASFNSVQYGDQPTYDCDKPGELIMKTLFTIMPNYNNESDDFSTEYEISFGLTWGIKLDSNGKFTPISISVMKSDEIEDILKIFRSEYNRAEFVVKPTFNVVPWKNDIPL